MGEENQIIDECGCSCHFYHHPLFAHPLPYFVRSFGCWTSACTMAIPTSFESIRASLDGSAISTYVLAMVILPIKLWCRLQGGKRNLGLDDALIIAAAVVQNGFFYNTMIGMAKSLS